MNLFLRSFPYFFFFFVRSQATFSISLLLDASHTVYRRGNFLFRTVPASRSNLSFKSTPVPMLGGEFPLRLRIARNGPLVRRRRRALSRYRGYAQDADVERGRHVSDRVTAHAFLAAPFERCIGVLFAPQTIALYEYHDTSLLRWKWLRIINIALKIDRPAYCRTL